MIPIAEITAWREKHPWSDDAQVEQDLVISRCLVELFNNPLIQNNLRFRGGTALHKLFLSPAQRYSEDIDLVQNQSNPIGEIFDSIRQCLEPLLGKPKRKQGKNVVNLIFRFESEFPPVQRLKLKVEINTREHFSVMEPIRVPFNVASGWFSGKCDIPTYQIEELLGTKLRALYQRNKGRDLFDLWMGLNQVNINPSKIIECFYRYLEYENLYVSKQNFEDNLTLKLKNERFISDIRPLIRSNLNYSVETAMEMVMDVLISALR